MSQTILIVEDDPYIVNILEFVLEDEGYTVMKAESGEDGWAVIKSSHIDLVLLDINLPGVDGLKVCNKIKKQYSIPVIIVSSRDRDDDVISGLEIGADDYIKKPFNHKEVILRIGKLLKRSAPDAAGRLVQTGKLSIDLGRESVYRDHLLISLTPTEFNILRCLAENLGRVVSWQVICREVWGTSEWEGGHELVKVNIRRLRKKIEEDPSQPEYIMNEWGKGYRLQDFDTEGL